jgi:hypothetical protein
MNKRLAWAIIASYICAAIMSGAAVVVAVKVDQNSNEKWCDLLAPLDEGNQKAPPKNQSGRVFAASIHRLVIDFGCEE